MVQPAALVVLLQPVAQPRPLAQQRLVCHLHRAGADHHEPAGGEHVEDIADRLVVVGLELVERHAPPHCAAARVLAGQPQQDAPRDGLLRRVEARVGGLGEPRDGAPHAAGALVAGEREERPSRRSHSSNRAVESSGSAPGSSSTSGQQPVDELRLDAQPGPLRGQLDRAPQLGALQRADEHVVGGEQPRQRRVRAQRA